MMAQLGAGVFHKVHAILIKLAQALAGNPLGHGVEGAELKAHGFAYQLKISLNRGAQDAQMSNDPSRSILFQPQEP